MSPSKERTHAEPPRFLTIPEAADYLTVSRRFIERLIQAETLPVHRFGRAVRIKRAALDQLAETAATRPVGGRGRGDRRG